MKDSVDLEYLRQLRHFIDTRQYWRIEEQLRVVDEVAILAEPAIGYALSVAYIHLRRSREGLELTEKILGYHEGRSGELLREIELFESIFLGREGRLREAELVARKCLLGLAADDHGKYAASVHNNLGVLLCQKGDWDDALPVLQRALAIYRQIGRAIGVASVCHNIGMTYRYLGHCEEAERFYQVASEYYIANGIVEEDTFTEAERSLAILGLGDDKLATRMVERAMERCRRIGNKELTGEIVRVAAIVYRETERFSESATLLMEAQRYAEQNDNTQLRAEVQLERGHLERATGRQAAAARCYRRAERHFRRTGATGWERIAREHRERTSTQGVSDVASATESAGTIAANRSSRSGSNDPESDSIIASASSAPKG